MPPVLYSPRRFNRVIVQHCVLQAIEGPAGIAPGPVAGHYSPAGMCDLYCHSSPRPRLFRLAQKWG